MKLIIIGSIPPPIGGVSTHVERIIPYLKDAGIDYVIWDYSKNCKRNKRIISLRHEFRKIISSVLTKGEVKVLHCLLSKISFTRLNFFLLLKIMGIRLTITLVGSPKDIINNNPLKLLYLLILTHLSSHVIAVNKDFYNIFINHGISEKKLSVIPAFIPFENNVFIEKPIPTNVVDFCLRHKPLIVTYAYGPVIFGKEDLYGLDLFVQLAQRLRKDLQQAGFVVVIPEISNKDYFNKIIREIDDKGLKDVFYFAIGNDFSFVPFMQYADLFIRATNTDGDALTLREALYCGVASIASDVCWRPDGTILFRNRDINDLYRAVSEVLYDVKSNIKTEPSTINNAELFIGVFKRTGNM